MIALSRGTRPCNTDIFWHRSLSPLCWDVQANAAAQVYPSRPITIVVPFPPAGRRDTFARTMAERMRVSLGQSVIIENVTGASGSIGTGRVARAAPDGYTLGYGIWARTSSTALSLALQYDVVSDFEPIALMSNAPLLIVARKAMPANDLSELIAWLKANPDKASMGTGGLAATSHLAGVLFQQETGTRFSFVPYRGASHAGPDGGTDRH